MIHGDPISDEQVELLAMKAASDVIAGLPDELRSRLVLAENDRHLYQAIRLMMVDQYRWYFQTLCPIA